MITWGRGREYWSLPPFRGARQGVFWCATGSLLRSFEPLVSHGRRAQEPVAMIKFKILTFQPPPLSAGC